MQLLYRSSKSFNYNECSSDYCSDDGVIIMALTKNYYKIVKFIKKLLHLSFKGGIGIMASHNKTQNQVIWAGGHMGGMMVPEESKGL